MMFKLKLIQQARHTKCDYNSSNLQKINKILNNGHFYKSLILIIYIISVNHAKIQLFLPQVRLNSNLNRNV